MDNRRTAQAARLSSASCAYLSDDYFSALEKHTASHVVSCLAQKRWHDTRAVALELGDDPRINVKPRAIRTIAIYYCQIACGGADRVVLDQAKTLTELGYRIVLITETPLADGVRNELPSASHILLSPLCWETDRSSYPQKARALERCLIEHKVDLVVYNQALSPHVLWDVLLIKAHGIPCIAWAHGVFTFPLTEIGKSNGVDHYIADLPLTLRLVDAVVCANKVDKAFWSRFNTTVYQTVYTPQVRIDSSQGAITAEDPPPYCLGRSFLTGKATVRRNPNHGRSGKVGAQRNHGHGWTV